jgi:putative ABC transport system permease protein
VRFARAWLLRLFGVFASGRSERDLSAELQSHLQLHIDDNIKAGMSPEEARRRALIALGGIEQTKESYRDRRSLPRLESLIRDLRYGVRTLSRSRGFALAGVLILGLGIGVNTAIFTVVNAVVLKPLPFADADRIMRIWHTPPPTLFAGSPTFALSPANFIDWEAQNQVFERMAIYRMGRRTLTGSGEPAAVMVLRASADFLPALGLSPKLGRGFTRDDDRSGGASTALVSEAFFRTRFGGDPSTIGKTIVLNRVPHTIIGVVPDAPVFIQRAQVYVPLAWTAEEQATRANHNYVGIAKLKPGVDVARAQADMTAISKRLEAQYPEDNTDWGALVRPLRDDMIGDVRTSLLVLLGAVGLVLLIACANLANLMLVRTHGRAKEIALRGALGAGRARVIQQLLAEGLVLGVGGGLAGLAAAYYGLDLLKATFGTALPRVGEVALDWRVLTFTALVSVTTGLISAFVPAWQLSGRDANEALKSGAARGNSSSGDGRLRNLLVVSEVALALMLLIGAGLLMRSLSGLRSVDPGFDASNVLTATVAIPEAKYATPEQRNQFFDRALANVQAIPGVDSAAWVDSLPFQGGSTQYVMAEGMPPMKESEMPVVAVRLTSPRYFGTARIQMIAGRDFDTADGYGKPRVVIVSENTAQRLWPGQNPLGKRITLTMMTKESAEVVGIVREVKMGSLDASEADSETALYAPAAQFAFNGSSLAVRTTRDPRSVTRSMVAAIQAVDPEQPVLDIATLEDVVEESLGQRPLAMLLLAGFAALALLLASVGIYSVLAYTVRQRAREIGIRMALGAPAGGVLRLVVVEGLKPTLIGVVLGLVLAALFVRVMATLLYGVSQHDLQTFGAVAALMLAVGIVATLVPAYRATRVDPIVTLRTE